MHSPVWQRIAGGCHLNRKIDDLLSDAGFRIFGWKLATSRGHAS
jgi:hypothetical protein